MFIYRYRQKLLATATAIALAVASQACGSSSDGSAPDDTGVTEASRSDASAPADAGPGAPADTGVGGGATLDQLVGVWAQDQLPGPVTVEMVGTQMNFKDIPASTSKSGWSNAMTKGFVKIGDPLIRDIAPSGTKFTASILWKQGTASSGVTEVAWSPCTMVVNSARSEIAITTTSPFSGTPSTLNGTLYKAP